MDKASVRRIETLFNEAFVHWDIRLPAATAGNPARGRINKAGWLIWYAFGMDERGDYLDYYASHRMTDDRHVRLRADGSEQELPAIAAFRLCSSDPAEDARLEADYQRRNRSIAELLREKGFRDAGGDGAAA